MTDRAKGYLLTALGVVILSPDALFLRLIIADEWSVLAWRGLLSAVVFFGFMLAAGERDFLRVFRLGGLPLLTVAVCYAISTVGFVYAIRLSSVADALVIIASTPLLAALLTWVFLKERPGKATAAAIALGGIGVIIAAKGGVGAGSVLGILWAVAAALALAVQFTVLRASPRVNNFAAIGLGSLMSGTVGLMIGAPLEVAGFSLLLCLVMGLAMTPISFGLITLGPRYLTSAEVSLLMLLETALGPLIVWIVLGEEPARSALIGGAFVVSAVAISAFGGRGLGRRKTAAG